jgi:hypothetical protein
LDYKAIGSLVEHFRALKKALLYVVGHRRERLL